MPNDVDRLAERAYRAWCGAQGSTPRPWEGRRALPDHRKQVWYAVAASLLTAEPVPMRARVVKMTERRTA